MADFARRGSEPGLRFSSPLLALTIGILTAAIPATASPQGAPGQPAAQAAPGQPAAQAAPGQPAAQRASDRPSSAPAAGPALPYSPVLDPAAMDRGVDPCVDFYTYSCGGWMKSHPMPADQSRWGVYDKLHEDNLKFLGQILEEAARPDAGRGRDPLTAQIGDFYASCMDEAAIARAGLAPLRPELDAIAAIRTPADLAEVVARLQVTTGEDVLFGLGSSQDYKDSTRVIAVVAQGGLGLPDRDYYLKDDPRSAEVRSRYVAYVERLLRKLGDDPAAAAAEARQVLALETALARASISRVEERTPANVYHKLGREQLAALTPAFGWDRYFAALGLPELLGVRELNVAEPGFFSGLQSLLAGTDLATLRTYLRCRLVDARASQLAPDLERDHFDFHDAFLHGVKEMKPRWRRCVEWVDGNLGEALGRVYVERAFSPEAKARTVKMVDGIEKAMDADLRQLPWMSAPTRAEALRKLHAVANKIGYPDRWRDYGSVSVARQDFAGNVLRATLFESRRQLAKIGRPVDRGEWSMTPPTVNAYYDPQKNDVNFPAGVLQPPLFDPRLEDAPNYGNTGGTIGHELTHGFDDEGRQFDYAGNLRDWWTPEDARAFETRARCIEDQYARYTVIDDVKINSKLTLGEDVADLGGLILAYLAWRDATRGQDLEPIDGFTPEQRFFIGYGQSWCTNQRDEDKRLRAVTDPHSPPLYRTNGVVSNLPEFRQAFGCKTGQPMAPPATCRVW
jgi:putative endopeptidase